VFRVLIRLVSALEGHGRGPVVWLRHEGQEIESEEEERLGRGPELVPSLVSPGMCGMFAVRGCGRVASLGLLGSRHERYGRQRSVICLGPREL
jgi:hypothetical protein